MAQSLTDLRLSAVAAAVIERAISLIANVTTGQPVRVTVPEQSREGITVESLATTVVAMLEAEADSHAPVYQDAVEGWTLVFAKP